MKHADLIARLEKLDGPDREVDALIEIEVRRLLAYAVGLDDQTRARWLIVGFKGEVEDGSVRYHSPEYTASLDAAVALGERLLPGQAWHLMTAALKAWSIRYGKASDFPRFYLIVTLRALQESDPA